MSGTLVICDQLAIAGDNNLARRNWVFLVIRQLSVTAIVNEASPGFALVLCYFPFKFSPYAFFFSFLSFFLFSRDVSCHNFVSDIVANLWTSSCTSMCTSPHGSRWRLSAPPSSLLLCTPDMCNIKEIIFVSLRKQLVGWFASALSFFIFLAL